MVAKRGTCLLVATIGSCLQAVSCSAPDDELCDQPEGGGTEDGGTEGADEGTLRSVDPRALGANTFRSWTQDPRVPVTNEIELQSYPLKAVVSVVMSYEEPQGIRTERGTGFLAGPRHAITNRHIIEVQGVDVNDWIDNPPKFFHFDVFPGRSKVATINGGAWAVERVVWNPFSGGTTNDYVLLLLEDDIDRSGQYGAGKTFRVHQDPQELVSMCGRSQAWRAD